MIIYAVELGVIKMSNAFPPIVPAYYVRQRGMSASGQTTPSSMYASESPSKSEYFTPNQSPHQEASPTEYPEAVGSISPAILDDAHTFPISTGSASPDAEQETRR